MIFIGKQNKSLTDRQYIGLVLGVNLALAFLSFVVFILKDHGVLILSHDYLAEDIPFSIFCNNAVKSGDIFWNWSIDIGSDFITSFSFYGLGSPFFWLGLLCPAEYAAYLMGWMFMLKYALAGLFSYLYVKRFVVDRKYALLASMLYSFSGFQSCNIIFYQFHDVVALFPLLLIGMEKLLQEKKKGWMAAAVCINALLNYFFFAGEVIFAVIYYLFRIVIPQIKKDRKFDMRNQWESARDCLIEGIIGIMGASVLFMPSMLSVMESSKAGNTLWNSNFLLFNITDLLYRLKNVLFPSDIMSYPSAYTVSNWYSAAAYLPMVSVLPAVVYVWNKKDWISNLIKASLVIALVPVLNNMFVMFNAELYCRWYYMPILICVLASAKAIEEYDRFNWKKPFVCILLIAAVLILFTILAPWEADGSNAVYRNLVFALQISIGIVGLITTFGIICSHRRVSSKLFTGIAVFAIATTVLNIVLYREEMTEEDRKTAYSSIVETAQSLKKDTLPYRYYIYDEYYDRALAGSLYSRQLFFTTVSNSINTLYDSLGTPRVINQDPNGPEGTNEILSVGYYVLGGVPWNEQESISFENAQEQVYVYDYTDKAIPIGYTYDSYMLASDFAKLPVKVRGMAMLKTLIIKDEDEAAVSKILHKYNEDEDGSYAVDNKKSIMSAHKSESSENFWKDNSHFGSVIESKGEKYAFYSVPYSDFWSASVNGTEVDIIEINGLMAIPINNGVNEIVFTYKNCYVFLGFILSFAGMAIWSIYVYISRKKVYY